MLNHFNFLVVIWKLLMCRVPHFSDIFSLCLVKNQTGLLFVGRNLQYECLCSVPCAQNESWFSDFLFHVIMYSNRFLPIIFPKSTVAWLSPDCVGMNLRMNAQLIVFCHDPWVWQARLDHTRPARYFQWRIIGVECNYCFSFVKDSAFDCSLISCWIAKKQRLKLLFCSV